MFNIGDIVLISRGHKTNFFEVIKVEDTYMWISNGWVQIRRKFKEVELICKAENRQDKKIPYIPFVNC